MLGITLGGVDARQRPGRRHRLARRQQRLAQSTVGRRPIRSGDPRGADERRRHRDRGQAPGQIDGYLQHTSTASRPDLANEVNNPTVTPVPRAPTRLSADPPRLSAGDHGPPRSPSTVTAGNVTPRTPASRVTTTSRSRSPVNSGGTADQAYDAFVSQIGSDAQAAGQQRDYAAGARHRGQQPAPERGGRRPPPGGDERHPGAAGLPGLAPKS